VWVFLCVYQISIYEDFDRLVHMCEFKYFKNMAAKIIPNRLKLNRKRFGLSQRDAAKLLSVTPTQLMQWEKGEKMPNGRNLLKLVALYKSLIEDMYFEQRQEACAEVEANKKKYLSEPDKPP